MTKPTPKTAKKGPSRKVLSVSLSPADLIRLEKYMKSIKDSPVELRIASLVKGLIRYALDSKGF